MARVLPLVVCLGVGAALWGGCSTLFPEFFGGNPHDAGTASDGGAHDGGGPPHIAGTVCILRDLRDYRSCASGSPGPLRITVEETRDQAMTDVAGHFSLPLEQELSTATVAAIDPRGVYAPSVIPLRLPGGATDEAVLPIVDAQTLSNAALQNGTTLDPARGSVLAWAIDDTGAPVAGVTFAPRDALVEGGGAGELSVGTRTGAHGTIADLIAAPTTLTITLAPPPSLPLKGDSYVLPVRAGAVTVSTLVLAPQ